MPRLHHRPMVSHHIQLEPFTLCNINKLLIISDQRAVQGMCVQIANRNVCHALQMMLTYIAIVLYVCLSPLCSWLHIWDWDRRLISSPSSSSYPPSKDNRKWGLLAAGILRTHTASNLRTELPSSTRSGLINTGATLGGIGAAVPRRKSQVKWQSGPAPARTIAL